MMALRPAYQRTVWRDEAFSISPSARWAKRATCLKREPGRLTRLIRTDWLEIMLALSPTDNERPGSVGLRGSGVVKHQSDHSGSKDSGSR